MQAMVSSNRTYPDVVVVRESEAVQSTPETGLTRTVLAFNDKLFLARHTMRKDWAGALHSHPHEQIVYVISGHLRVMTPGAVFEISAGDSFLVRGGVQHAATALEDSVVIDVFTPCREDYIG
jgi:quercetin dioxygenase-like cupin family protein